MADEAADRKRASARFELSDLLPDGEVIMPLERDGEFVMLVRRGQMTPEVVSEINKRLEHIVGNGLWEQRWGGPCTPHPDKDV
ncbi:hypothetical protein [Streptomyces aureoversilis]|uniref:Uncharacterized protein n=1 Tax=Streptomyces aureoversilis TaxID=67277 RepID=A0ABV9ZU64_9ACTN